MSNKGVSPGQRRFELKGRTASMIPSHRPPVQVQQKLPVSLFVLHHSFDLSFPRLLRNRLDSRMFHGLLGLSVQVTAKAAQTRAGNHSLNGLFGSMRSSAFFCVSELYLSTSCSSRGFCSVTPAQVLPLQCGKVCRPSSIRLCVLRIALSQNTSSLML